MTATTTTTTPAEFLDYLDRKAAAASATLDKARADLATKATSSTLSDIGHGAGVVASAWGAVEVWSAAVAIVRHGVEHGEALEDTVAEVRAWAVGLLVRGADDTWSGRGNDLARMKFDGVRSAVERIVNDATFAAEGRS